MISAALCTCSAQGNLGSGDETVVPLQFFELCFFSRECIFNVPVVYSCLCAVGLLLAVLRGPYVVQEIELKLIT